MPGKHGAKPDPMEVVWSHSVGLGPRRVGGENVKFVRVSVSRCRLTIMIGKLTVIIDWS